MLSENHEFLGELDLLSEFHEFLDELGDLEGVEDLLDVLVLGLTSGGDLATTPGTDGGCSNARGEHGGVANGGVGDCEREGDLVGEVTLLM